MSVITQQLRDAAATITASKAATEIKKEVVLQAEEDRFTHLIPKAYEAAAKLDALISAHSAGVAALEQARGSQPWVNQGRNSTDYTRLEQAIKEFRNVEKTAAVLRSVEAEIKRTRVYTGFKRQYELDALHHVIMQGLEMPARVENDLLPRLAMLAGKVAARERARAEGGQVNV